MKNVVELGMNRTGLGMSPVDSKTMIDAAAKTQPSSPADGEKILGMRVEYGKQADPIGTVPPPPTMKGVAKAALDRLKGTHPTVLLDKLGERLAFERTGTRLYEALLTKLDIAGGWNGGPTRDELQRIHDAELAHFEMLRKCIEELGADPTAVTPSADVVAVASMGLLQVLSDPRTNLAQGLHAIHIAELADNDSWEMLTSLAKDLGKDALAKRFEGAYQDEQRHLADVRRWLKAHVKTEAKA